jgi:choice-of-anchor B domain-containing protein
MAVCSKERSDTVKLPRWPGLVTLQYPVFCSRLGHPAPDLPPAERTFTNLFEQLRYFGTGRDSRDEGDKGDVDRAHSIWVVAACLIASAEGLGHESEPVDAPDPGGGTSGVEVHCDDGSADGFPCRNVDLLARVPLADLALGWGNDLWGWTDPLTGREIAIFGLYAGVAFIDVTEPEHPVHLATLPPQTTASRWRDIKVYDDHAFIVSEARHHGMQVLDLGELRDISTPPVTLEPSAHYAGFGNAHNLAIDEETGFAYAVGTTGSCAAGLHIVNVRDPRNPRGVGCYSGDGYTHDAQCVVYRGPDLDHQGREICFNANEDTVTIVDVTNKGAPRQLSRTGYVGRGYTHQGWLSEDHAFFLLGDEFDEILGGHGSRTYVWDISDLDAPRVIGDYTGTSLAIDHNLYIRGDHVFQANYTSGLRVRRFGRLEQLEIAEVAYFDTVPEDDSASFDGAWSVYPFFESGTVIVSDINRGLYVLHPHLEAVPECSDQLDNDRDGRVDYPDDPACAGPDGARERPIRDAAFEIKSTAALRFDNSTRRGVIGVVIFGSDSLDVDEIETGSLAFGDGAAPPAHKNGPHPGDVNGDGFRDLLGHYRFQAAGIAAGDPLACLRWHLRDGTPYESCAELATRPR